MNELLQEVTPVVLELVSIIIIGLIGFTVPKVKTFFDDKGITEKLTQYDYLADVAVMAVEQIYKNEHGEVKKQQAKEYIIHSLNEMNLSITEQQLDMFVEAAVKRAKDEWNKPEVVVVDEPKVDKKLLEEAEKLFEKEEIK